MISTGRAGFIGLRIAATARRAGPIAIGLVCLIWALGRLETLDINALLAALDQVTALQWSGALTATAISFFAVAQYDVLFHRWLNTGIPCTHAACAGASSVAIAQMLGFGLVTGTVARWRALPRMSLGEALVVTQYVSFSFMVALGLLTCLIANVFPVGGFSFTWGASAIAATLSLLGILLSLVQPSILPFSIPPLSLMARLGLWMTLDVLFAATALYLLLPPDLGLPFGTVFAAFVLALSAGLMSGSPGGVGPFELCLIALLPMLPEADLIAGVLAFRLVYYAIPAIFGATYLFRAQGPQEEQPRPRGSSARRAEAAGLSKLPNHEILPCGEEALHVARTSQCLVAIGAVASGGTLSGAVLGAFEKSAESRALTPILYKSPAHAACLARRRGWSVIRISDEAFLSPRDFNIGGPERRQLRRKLKRATSSGVLVEHSGQLPISAMKTVSEAWALRNGGERGFSMGRFDPDYIASQTCFLAWRGKNLVAFATFHTSENEWCLDLMRSTDDAGDGTMHALIVAAIASAKDAGIPRLSLAAMPVMNPGLILRAANGAAGLRRFKMAFAPKTQPLYLAAPNSLQLAIAGMDILLRVRFPDTNAPASGRLALQEMQGRFSDMLVVQSAQRAHVQQQEMKLFFRR